MDDMQEHELSQAELYDSARDDYLAGNLSEALEKWHRILRSVTEEIARWVINFNIGECHLWKEEYDLAVQYLGNARLTADGESTPSYDFRINLGLGVANFYLSNYDESLNCLLAAKKLISNDLEAKRFEFFECVFFIAEIYISQKNFLDAVPVLIEAREFLPYGEGFESLSAQNLTRVNYRLGNAYNSLEQYDMAFEALSKIDKVVCKPRTWCFVLDIKGSILMRKNCYREARLEFYSALEYLEFIENTAKFYYYIGYCSHKMNEDQEARKYLQMCLSSETTTLWVHDDATKLLGMLDGRYNVS